MWAHSILDFRFLFAPIGPATLDIRSISLFSISFVYACFVSIDFLRCDDNWIHLIDALVYCKFVFYLHLTGDEMTCRKAKFSKFVEFLVSLSPSFYVLDLNLESDSIRSDFFFHKNRNSTGPITQNIFTYMFISTRKTYTFSMFSCLLLSVRNSVGLKMDWCVLLCTILNDQFGSGSLRP